MKLKKFLFKKVKNTNNTAIRLIKHGNDNGIVSSETQTKGKGQRENKWISKKGNLFISIFIGINIINSPNILNYPTTFLNNYSKKKINKIKIINKIKLNFEKKYKG